MREAGLRVRSRKRWQLVSSSRDALPIAPNHLDRQFASDRANQSFGHERPKTGCIWPSYSISIHAMPSAGHAPAMQQALVRAALEAAVARRQPKEERLLYSNPPNTARTTTRPCFGEIE